MREMKPSSIEWIGNIPLSWKVMPNKYLMRKKKEICPVYNGEDIMSLTMKGVIVRDLDAGGKMPTSFDGYQRLEPGNLLMCLFDIDVTPRCIGLIKQVGLSSPAYSQFILNDGADAAYYCYYYTMLDNDKTLLHLAKNLRHSLTEDQLGAIPVIVPPTNEQRRIATFLDKKCAEIDTLTADIQTQIETLEQYKRSVITETVTKGLNPGVKMKDSGVLWIGNMPSHWKIIRGKYILRYMQKPVREDDGVITCFRDGEVTLRSNRREDGFTMSDKEIGYQGIDIGDLVVHGMDGFAGSIGISDSRGKASPVLNVLDTDQSKRYIMYYLRSMAYSDVFLALATGIRVRSCDLRWNKLADLLYPVPPIAEQKAIVEHIDAMLAKADAVISDKKAQLATLDDYKKSLIFEYVTGKKEVPQTVSVTAVTIDPHVIMLGIVIDKLGKKQLGKVQLQKIIYLMDVHIGLNSRTQYYRYQFGPYDQELNSYIDTLVEKKWFVKKHQGSNLLVPGKNHSAFVKNYHDTFSEHQNEIDKLIAFLKPMKTSQAGRIATLYAVWNDFIIDGNTAPTDNQIIHEVTTNWTVNKANTTDDTWQETLNKMRRNGIIPRGTGLHTLPQEAGGQR